MLWFSHDCDARHDKKLLKLRLTNGAEGYAFYFYCLELLGDEEKPFVLDDTVAHDFMLRPERMKELMDACVEIGLFDKDRWKEGQVYTKKVEDRADTYTKQKKARKKRLNVPEPKLKGELEEFEKTWNQTDLPRIITWNKERKLKLSTRLMNTHFKEHHKEAIAKLSKSSFALGRNDRNWKASVDWFISNDNNYVKALEGKYDDKERDPFDKYR